MRHRTLTDVTLVGIFLLL